MKLLKKLLKSLFSILFSVSICTMCTFKSNSGVKDDLLWDVNNGLYMKCLGQSCLFTLSNKQLITYLIHTT